MCNTLKWKGAIAGGYNSLKLAQPVQQLVETCAILPSTGALSNQGGVSGEDDSFSHTTVAFATNFSIVEL